MKFGSLAASRFTKEQHLEMVLVEIKFRRTRGTWCLPNLRMGNWDIDSYPSHQYLKVLL